MIPAEFLTMISSMPGIDGEAFARAMSEPASVSIKVNRRKLPLDSTHSINILGYGELEHVKWCNSGFYLDQRPKFTLHPLLHAGVFYVQDASSMIHETLTKSIIDTGDIPSDPLVLDLCAAPGGKTTSIINALPDGATVIANEVMPQRAQILKENLLKWGYPQIIATSSQTKSFAACGEIFDIIAVDAPCSGEGMMRKDEKAVEQWSHGLIAKCANLQREILSDAYDALRPGGYLIYSTCTFNRQEDEENVEWLVENLGLEPVTPSLPDNTGIGTQIESPYPALRFMPHLTRGEGLFAAILRKPGNAPAANRKKAIETIKKKTKVILDGIPRVTTKGKTDIPTSEWALSTDFPKDQYPFVELEEELALSYLRHEALRLPESTPRGFIVVTYKGFPLGFVKNIGNRANNLFPSEWRIRNL